MASVHTIRLQSSSSYWVPPFELWVVPLEPVGVYRPIVGDADDPLYADKDFILDEWTIPFPSFFDVHKKGEKKLEDLEI